MSASRRVEIGMAGVGVERILVPVVLDLSPSALRSWAQSLGSWRMALVMWVLQAGQRVLGVIVVAPRRPVLLRHAGPARQLWTVMR
ncbi:hypothetical protein [Mycobacterium marinum]|uniref:hypothetical protein n=1 Tax=Mycobacterium marinum TaxID=1781 RepID=UPI00031B7AD9|nr:hypothetical protein [Mycobacterium marinum]